MADRFASLNITDAEVLFFGPISRCADRKRLGNEWSSPSQVSGRKRTNQSLLMTYSFLFYESSNLL
jgi:hypothetical protein